MILLDRVARDYDIVHFFFLFMFKCILTKVSGPKHHQMIQKSKSSLNLNGTESLDQFNGRNYL